MRKFTKIAFKTSLLLLSFLLFGCSELIDCIAKSSPVISTNGLPDGNVGTVYNEYVNSQVRNDSNDDDYNYYFSVEGSLPPGITYHTSGRRVYFTGNPTASGNYTFKVFLTIEFPEYYDPNQGFFEDNNRICFGDDSTSKEYTIIIY